MEQKKFSASTQMTPAIYKDFYKTYYNEKLKVFKVVSLIIAVIAFIGAVYILKNDYGIMWGVIAAWIGVFLIFYPNMVYRKPYKKEKNKSQMTHFSFYENYLSEKTKSQMDEHKYTDIKKIMETNKYFFIFYNADSVSIVDKSHMSCDSDEMSAFLKTKTEYKKVK